MLLKLDHSVFVLVLHVHSVSAIVFFALLAMVGSQKGGAGYMRLSVSDRVLSQSLIELCLHQTRKIRQENQT